MISSREYLKYKNQLMDEFNHKCAYCGSKLGITDHGYIEHFYPRSIYPEKSLDLDNLLIACQICNVSKSAKFPLDDNGKPLLLNPRTDSYGEHIALSDDGLLHSKSERGAATIEILNLNRSELVERRRYEIIERKYYEMSPAQEINAFDVFNESLSKIKILNATPLDNSNGIQQYFSNLLYANVITALETLLTDVFIKKVQSNKKHLRKFVETFHDFKQERFDLREIFERYEAIEDKVNKSMRDVIYHDLPKVKGMYVDTFGIKFPDIADIYKIVFIRHDLVHRNGTKKNGEVHAIKSDDVISLCAIAEFFVSELKSEINKI